MGSSDSGSQPRFACEDDLQIPSLRNGAYTKAGRAAGNASFRAMRKGSEHARLLKGRFCRWPEEFVRGGRSKGQR